MLGPRCCASRSPRKWSQAPRVRGEESLSRALTPHCCLPCRCKHLCPLSRLGQLPAPTKRLLPRHLRGTPWANTRLFPGPSRRTAAIATAAKPTAAGAEAAAVAAAETLMVVLLVQHQRHRRRQSVRLLVLEMPALFSGQAYCQRAAAWMKTAFPRVATMHPTVAPSRPSNPRHGAFARRCLLRCRAASPRRRPKKPPLLARPRLVESSGSVTRSEVRRLLERWS